MLEEYMLKMLLVDDSLLILKRAEAILKKNKVDADIMLAQSGEIAIEMIQSQPIDIVLLDIIMPTMSGIEVLKKIKSNEETKAIKVLMFSSLVNKTTLKQCFEYGAIDYIMKPLEEIEFLSRVTSAMREKQLEIENIWHIQAFKHQNEELAKLNEQLQNTQSQLVQQEKMAGVGQLAAGVAHEINNPLGFIISNMSTLKGYVTSYQSIIDLCQNQMGEMDFFRLAKQNVDLDFIQNDIVALFSDMEEGFSRVKTIVNGLRNFSRIDQIDEYESYDLNKGIEDTLVISKNEVKYFSKITLELGNISLIEAIGGQINQVLLNIILNANAAIKSRWKDRLGEIYIKTFETETHVYCSIRDNGSGIDQEHLRLIFDPFFTTKPVGSGTGLGLSISYDIIVNKHHGSIDVTSKLGEGTTFLIALPMAHLEEKEIDVK